MVNPRHNNIASSQGGNIDSLEENNDESVISRETFVLDDYRKMKFDVGAEGLSGQKLVDYVNRRQDLWTATSNVTFESFTNFTVNHIHNSIEAKKHQSSCFF
uniref:Uncharacterized protein n=1 Tax=Panagrolaimus superbus TaxID=310955 RepID=A0A914ZHS2_9BILA